MNTNQEVTYIGTYAENPYGLLRNPFMKWIARHIELSGDMPGRFSVSFELPGEFESSHIWKRQPCLPENKRWQRLLPWAQRCYHRVIHLALYRPDNTQDQSLYDWCLCLRWPRPLRYIAEADAHECTVYWHRVGECPCMEYASWHQTIP